MTLVDLLEALRRDGAAMASAAERAGLDAPVPSCPGWDVRKLLDHLGRVHRWVTAMVRSQSPDRLDFPPSPPVVETQWFAEGVTELAAALREAGPEAPVWTFAGTDATVRFWFLRQAAETAVHRWDAELAAGEPTPIEPAALAVAGIDEMFGVLLRGFAIAAVGASVHLHATDVDGGEWTVRPGEDGTLTVDRSHQKGDVAIRATASDLLLWAWGRPVPSERLETFGDTAVLERWRQVFGTG